MRHTLSALGLALLVACSFAHPAATCACSCCQPDPTPGVSFHSYGQSVFNDYNDDGIPDDPHAAAFFDTDGDGVPDLSVLLGALFADTDDDGVPDTRVVALGGSAVGVAKTLIARASRDVLRAADGRELEEALASMEVAIGNARRAVSGER